MMKYTVYKTVNLVNGKFYIGVHKTDNPNDDYLGSGKFIKRAVAKYGEQNFRKEILAVFEIQREAFDLEKKLVVEAKVDPLCYNLKAGGEGGFDWINRKGLNNSNENGVKGNRVTIGKIKTDPKVKKRFTDRINRVRPVSYTHLDVYKRQARLLVAQIGRSSRRNRFLRIGDQFLKK